MSNRVTFNRDEASFAFTHHVRDHCLCLHVQRAARAVARRFDEALRPVGLTQGQFSLLTALNRTEPPTIGAVANLLALDRTTLTANLKPLERRGLVKVKVDRDDKRSRRLILTPAGHALLAAAAPIWKRAHAQAERLLRSASPDMLRTGLRELC
ncbi:MAG: MarR family winged helix-turn-helix transcriptional regulator [Xanthobacteraceae bacterium]